MDFGETVDFLENLVKRLSPVANELNDKVEMLADQIGEVDDELEGSEELISDIKNNLNSACSILSELTAAFSESDSEGRIFVDELKKRFSSVSIGIVEGEFESILNSEAERLLGLQLNEVVVDLIIRQMREGRSELRGPQPMEDPNNILDVIKNTKKRICDLSHYGDQFKKRSSIVYLRAATGCVINVCVVTGDALTPFVVQDPTLKSYAIAVKSVFSGFRKLKEHGSKLLEGINLFRRRILRNHMNRRDND